jgi:uncharacterized membrane protein
MVNHAKTIRLRRYPNPLGWIMVLISLIGLSLNLFLLVRHFSEAGPAVAGCGGEGCDEVLRSRWAMLFGLPITLFGTAAYLLALASLTRWLAALHAPMLGAISGAALWFMFVQRFLLEAFCPWCVAAHCMAIALLGIGLGKLMLDGPSPIGALKQTATWMAASLLTIGLIQVYSPAPDTHWIEDREPRANGSPRLQAESGRRISLAGGRSFDLADLPLLGSPSAKHVLVEYFDYQCATCRVMAGHLETLVARRPTEVAVALLPVPLDRKCNPRLPAASEHPGSCEITRIALAIWRSDPASFAAIHKALLAGTTPAAASARARELLGDEALESALADPWIDDIIRSGIADWRTLSASTDRLPKLMIRENRILHGLPGNEQEFIQVIENELGL